jgi:hypothetical protein
MEIWKNNKKEVCVMEERIEMRSKYSELEKKDIEKRLMESNKDVSIKGATDAELEKILYRLEMEERTQNLIRSIKRKSMSEFERMDTDSLQISTETPIKDLYHYGILGMKWGVRRGSKSGSSTVKRTSGSDDYQKAKTLKRKSLKDMSNKEIEDLTRRLQLETNYRRLNPVVKSKGRRFAEAALKTVGKKAAEEFNKQFVGPQVEKIMAQLIKKAAKGAR